MQKIIILILTFAALAYGLEYDDCDSSDLKEVVFGNCDKPTKDERVIYSKTCINEGDNRNYTLGWAGKEEITCIRIKTNGKVNIVQGGVGNVVAVINVESTIGVELAWESDIFIKK